MRTVGIIGGLGPETTAKFYLEIIFSCYKKCNISRPPILIWSIPIKYRVEKDLITRATGEERYMPFLVDAAKRLEDGGADFLVIPCNSVHIFIEEVRKAVKIPVLSIVEETANFLKKRKIKRVGLLANNLTVRKLLYQQPLNKAGIEVVLPISKEQIKIGELISRLVLNEYTKQDKKDLLDIIGHLKTRGVKNVILACTDLQLLAPSCSRLQIYDTMKILAHSTVNEILRVS